MQTGDEGVNGSPASDRILDRARIAAAFGCLADEERGLPTIGQCLVGVEAGETRRVYRRREACLCGGMRQVQPNGNDEQGAAGDHA